MHGAIITAANLSVQESAAKGDKNGDRHVPYSQLDAFRAKA
jgi:hypothetical protein